LVFFRLRPRKGSRVCLDQLNSTAMGVFSLREPREQGSPRPQRGHHVHRSIYPLGHPATHFENPPQYPGPSTPRPSQLGSPIPGKGGLRTPARKARASPGHVPGRPGTSCLIIGSKWNASAFVGPYHADAETAPLRGNRPPHYPRAFPREAMLPWVLHPAEGRALHARNEGIGFEEDIPR
jgi:hypothetical protein